MPCGRGEARRDGAESNDGSERQHAEPAAQGFVHDELSLVKCIVVMTASRKRHDRLPEEFSFLKRRRLEKMNKEATNLAKEKIN